MAIDQRMAELLVHGVLHLFGYDHEAVDSDAAAMERRSRSLLQLLGRSDTEVRRQEQRKRSV
jgi:probable rRNA maturation factor